MAKTHEYTFNATLFAVIKVKAKSVKAARKAMQEAIDCIDLSDYPLALEGEVVISECSLTDCDQTLDQIDGQEV